MRKSGRVPLSPSAAERARVLSERPATEAGGGIGRLGARHRLRARRIRVQDLAIGSLEARLLLAGHGAVTATVDDLSAYGLALVLPAEASAALVLVGDRLEGVRVTSDEALLYAGDATVRRVADRDGRTVVGIELSSGGLDLGELYRRHERSGFAARLDAIERSARSEDVSPAFKSWVADVRSYLETVRDFLDAEERALGDVDLLTRTQLLGEYLDEAAPAVVERMNRAARELTDLVVDLPVERHAVHRAYVRKHVVPLLRMSPLLHRACDKPLGYAGDYEVMNMLYRDHGEGPTLFSRALNVYGAQESAARANINRIEYLGQKLRDVVRGAAGRRVRVASIGCGPARELYELLSTEPALGPSLDVALIDQEEQAIKYCERTLGPLALRCGARVEFIRESVRSLLTRRQLSVVLGERELIYSAGLFDYLSTRTFGALLASLYDALVPGGRLVIGNVAAENPTRAFMEYCLDWFLIHRSPAELSELAGVLVPQPSAVEVESEELGLNLFLVVRK